jgi:hypothetical protein
MSLTENCLDAGINTEAFMSPNPISKSNEDVTIRFNKEINSNSELKIINSLGNTIYETEYKSTDAYNSLKLHVKHLELGIYFLEVKNKTGNYRFKFIVVD